MIYWQWKWKKIKINKLRRWLKFHLQPKHFLLRTVTQLSQKHHHIIEQRNKKHKLWFLSTFKVWGKKKIDNMEKH